MVSPAQETYDHLAPAYDRRWSSYIEATLRATLEGLELHNGDRVLDLAAGTGELVRGILGRYPGSHVVGLDISRAMLAQAIGKSGPRSWESVQGDAARLPFGDGSFDAVICANAFHIFPEPEVALGEIGRVLRPGGMLTMTDWCDDYLTCKVLSLYVRLIDPSFHRAYRLGECRRLLEGKGFRVASARRFKIDWLWGLMRLEGRRA